MRQHGMPHPVIRDIAHPIVRATGGTRTESAPTGQLVARIALYPDPLLANILTASTYWTEIPEAAAWADEHSYLKGDVLAQAMQADHLQWDPNIMALCLFLRFWT